MKNTIWVWLLLIFGNVATNAQPVIHAKCAQKINLRAPKAGAGVYFDKDCKIGYVLPPVTGDVRLTAIAKNASLNQCSILNSFTRVFEVQARQLAEAAEQLDQIINSSADDGNSGTPLFPDPPENVTSPIDDQAIREKYANLLDAYVDSMRRLKEFWSWPGATAQLSYQVEHQDLVEAYAKLNPGFSFRAMPLRSSKVYLARYLAQSTPGAETPLPAVLSAQIPGSPGAPTQTGELGDDSGIASGDAQSGQIVLTLLGACPYYNSISKSFPKALGPSDLSAHLVAKVQYIYDLQAQREYHLKYNLGAFIRRVQSSESKGGLFSTRTLNRMIVEEKTTDWFEIEVKADDGRWGYDAEFAQTMKAQVIDRALRNIGLLVQGRAVDSPELTKPGANGASVAAGELRKCPNFYCQVGAAVLDVANAIFGSSVAVAEYIRTHDTWVTEVSSESKPLIFQGTVDFRRSK